MHRRSASKNGQCVSDDDDDVVVVDDIVTDEPQQGYVPGTDKDRCACYDSDAINVYGTSLRVYPDCAHDAASCLLPPKAKLTAEHAYRQKAE